MSAALTKARSNLNRVGSLLKQDKMFPAVTSLFEAVNVMLKSQLMKAERTEFSHLITDAVYLLNNNDKLRASYPLVIDYQPGEEKQLSETLRELLNALQDSAVDGAKLKMEADAKRKKECLERGLTLLAEKRYDEARDVLEQLAKEFPDDSDLKAQIADLFIKGELYEDAFRHLDQALDLSPEQIHLYNRIGIVLRRLKKFEIAEKYFMRAVNYAKKDANLYFNLGRVYVDWERWDKVEKAAAISLRLSPDFVQARKMRDYALKKQGKQPPEAG